MNKKEVSEIRKQFTPERCTVTRICGCYVDHEKTKKTELREAFLSLPDEELFKYLTIFKQTLSGSVGRNLMNMDFPLEQEREGGAQEFLLRLRDSRLQDDSLVEEFYDKIIENYLYGENYYIILIHAAYDIPGKATDGSEMFDASDDVYEYLLCSICPVKLSKAGLCYNPEANTIEDRNRDWCVDAPINGFLFPVFNDRNTDIHGALYFSKKPDDPQPEFIEHVLGCSHPLSAGDQKETFNAILSDTLGDDFDYNVIKSIHDNLNELIEENKDNPEPLELTKIDVRKLLEESGVPGEKLETFDSGYCETAGEKTSLLAANIANTRTFHIQTPDVIIKVNPEHTDLVETKIIDGRQCLVIVVDDHIEVNGVNVRTILEKDGSLDS